MCDNCAFVSIVGLILMVVAFLADSMTRFMVLLDILQEPLVIVASCGVGHMLALKASTTTCWSGRLTGMLVVPPGMSILLSFMWTRGGDLGVLCVLCCVVLTSWTWFLGDNLVRSVVLFVLYCVLLTSGTWSLGNNLVRGIVLCVFYCVVLTSGT